MSETVEKSLALWGMTGAHYHLIAARENAVFKITTATDTYALRLHRQGYRTDAELWSELSWMEAVSAGGITVPAPIHSLSGDVLQTVDGVQVDVLTWLSGETLDIILANETAANRKKLFHALGQEMGRLHDVSDRWDKPDGFKRCAWDSDGMLGDAPLWGRFWDNPALSSEDRSLFVALRLKAQADLSRHAVDLDYGLIHADLVAANVIVDANKLRFIDFDDGGFGFRVFEMATALLKHLDAPDYPALKAALISGYKSIRHVDHSTLDLFIALRATTYVGWNIARMDEDGARARNARFINTAKRLATVYLA